MDDVAINKISIIKKCLRRIEEEYHGHEKELDYNYTKQDSIILNLQRACEASIDLGLRLIRIRKLGVPQGGRDVFVFLQKENLISSEVSEKMQQMVGFRNIAVHDYQKVNLDIVRSILEHHLSDFNVYIEALLLHVK